MGCLSGFSAVLLLPIGGDGLAGMALCLIVARSFSGKMAVKLHHYRAGIAPW